MEGIFSKLTRQRPRNAVFESIDDCTSAVEAWLEHHNENRACAFRWGRKPEKLVASWKRGHQLISNE